MPLAPASMFLTNRSCPGTSTNPKCTSPTRHLGKSEIDRYAAPFLLGQTVGVDARQRFNERGLAVIDMPGGADDHVHIG